THFHGDHSLGLPGVVQRLSLDEVEHPVALHFPASGAPYVDRLLHASVFEERTTLQLRPVVDPGVVEAGPPFALEAAHLDHEPETMGWRLVEPAGRTVLPDRLDESGVHGPDVGRLVREGSVAVTGRPDPVRIEDVSTARPGQVVAFVMDTGLCDAAFALAEGADLLVCEATFAEADAALARQFRHLTAAQAGRIAEESGARRLVITHFSQRYPDAGVLAQEAAAVFPDVVCAKDLLHVAVPPRRAQMHPGARF
ncbi:MAG TPA: ribonuclease Z, partial [Acidimicrobiaceae bacterium]|nr:ribonuclease Z [Acidimicrobiaceae bacterium]